jgi:hypothetical protein
VAPSDPPPTIALGQRVLRENIASVYGTYIASTLTHMASWGCSAPSSIRS